MENKGLPEPPGNPSIHTNTKVADKAYPRNHDGHDADDAILKEIQVQKYTGDGRPYEAVIVAGKPCFVRVSADYRTTLEDKIFTPTVILLPPDKTTYLNKEYEFSSLTELQDYVNMARDETLDSLYRKTKHIWTKYIVADDDHLTICAADTIFTYFQDKMGQTHYLIYVGDNGTGKSNNLVVFQYLGYRALYNTSITPANIYSFLGSFEEGQGIILEDEADDIDINPEKMRICKAGYNSGVKIPRVDISFGRKQQSYFAFCFKAYTTEREPDKDKAKGFMERTFVLHCAPGSPQYDIKEVISPAGDEEYEELLRELIHLRKLLLAYRLITFSEPIPNIELNIMNREKQLCKPLLRLFQNSECKSEISKTLMKLLGEKREKKNNTLEANLYRIVTRLTQERGTVISQPDLWNIVKEELEGDEIPGKPHTISTQDHGWVTHRQVVNILKDKFQAKPGRDMTSRLLIFNKETLAKVGTTYNISDTIEILKATERLDHFADGESIPSKNESCPSLTVECPECHKLFETERGLEDHGVLTHEGIPVMADYEAAKANKAGGTV